MAQVTVDSSTIAAICETTPGAILDAAKAGAIPFIKKEGGREFRFPFSELESIKATMSIRQNEAKKRAAFLGKERSEQIKILTEQNVIILARLDRLEKIVETFTD